MYIYMFNVTIRSLLVMQKCGKRKRFIQDVSNRISCMNNVLLNKNFVFSVR